MNLKSQAGYTTVALLFVFVILFVVMIALLVMRSSKFNPGDPLDLIVHPQVSQNALDDDVKQLSNNNPSTSTDADFSSVDKDIQSL